MDFPTFNDLSNIHVLINLCLEGISNTPLSGKMRRAPGGYFWGFDHLKNLLGFVDGFFGTSLNGTNTAPTKTYFIKLEVEKLSQQAKKVGSKPSQNVSK